MLRQMDKKGVSAVIGYVLLVSMAVIMGTIMYTWMQSYVPNDSVGCPEGTSILLKDYGYSCTDKTQINLTLKNNGRFNLAGYYVKVANVSGQGIASIDVSEDLIETGGEFRFARAIMFREGEANTFEPGEEVTHLFNVSDYGEIYLVEILPIRWEETGNKVKFLSCGVESKSKQEVVCHS